MICRQESPNAPASCMSSAGTGMVMRSKTGSKPNAKFLAWSVVKVPPTEAAERLNVTGRQSADV